MISLFRSNDRFGFNRSLCKEDSHSINISFGMAWRIIMFHSWRALAIIGLQAEKMIYSMNIALALLCKTIQLNPKHDCKILIWFFKHVASIKKYLRILGQVS